MVFYNQRGTAERYIKEGKNAVKWTRLSCRTMRGKAVRLQLHALAYNLANFLRAAINAHRAEEGRDPKETAIPVAEFRKRLREGMKALEMDENFTRRYLNEGFSGGEKKRLEILQMTMLRPTMAVMDETDSGLDIDALRIVAEGVNRLASPEMGVLVITHYQRLLNYIKPHFVSVMMEGRIVRDAGPELALELEEKGYDWLREELAGAA